MLPEGQYRDLIQTLIERRKHLGIPQMRLDEIIGWPLGYTGKVEVGVRLIRLTTACEVAQALGGELVFRPFPAGHKSASDAQLTFLPTLLRAPAHPNQGAEYRARIHDARREAAASKRRKRAARKGHRTRKRNAEAALCGDPNDSKPSHNAPR